MNQEHGYLTKMMLDYLHETGQQNIYYNEFPLQQDSNYVQTCGRWVVCRLTYPTISIDKFYKIFENLANETGLSKDVLVCAWF